MTLSFAQNEIFLSFSLAQIAQTWIYICIDVKQKICKKQKYVYGCVYM